MAGLDGVLARLASLHPKSIDLSLDRIHALLRRLGDPHRQLPPVIHVAGTNGKGSTIAFMRALLEAQGHTAHVYTSPHLVAFRERFRLGQAGGGRLAEDSALEELFAEVEQANAGAPITQFEITTAAGFLLFSRHPADVLLLEVGLGGRLDATNVIERPAAVAITPVSIDHADFLGDTLPKIAAEKAGIIKRGRPCVMAPQALEAHGVIEAVAEAQRARLIIGGMDYQAQEEGGRLVYSDDEGLLDLPLPALAGRHQVLNAGTAIATVKAAGFSIDPDAAARAMRSVRWPARLQRLTGGALATLLPADCDLWLDGGHNEDGGRVLAEAMADLIDRSPRPLVMVCGMLTTKDPCAFLGHFEGLAAEVYGVAIDHPASLRAEELVEAAKLSGLRAQVSGSVAEALGTISRATTGTSPPHVLICGSLYLAGEVLRANGTPPL